MVGLYVISLGCSKNTVDTERIVAKFPVECVLVQTLEEADTVFINTCGFIQSAVEESVETILDIISKTRAANIIVAGCLVGRYSVETLSAEMPEVTLWLSNADMDSWPQKIANLYNTLPQHSCARRKGHAKSYAWLKIAEGCSHTCSFCTIPSIRGPYISHDIATIEAEAIELIGKGVQELVVIAQDTTSWGKDLLPQQKLATLLTVLGSLPIPWIRLLYLYPAGITEQLLETMATIPACLPYFDVPLQHAHPDILASMGRPFAHDPWKIIKRIRAFFPDAALRTSIIVGFPGETEEHYRALLDFIEEACFAHVGVFTYSQEEGTAAAVMENQVPEVVKEERRATLMEVQKNNARQYLASFKDKTLSILVDAESKEWDGLYQGRAWFQAPEIDGITYISGDFEGSIIGNFHDAVVVETKEYDLVTMV